MPTRSYLGSGRNAFPVLLLAALAAIASPASARNWHVFVDGSGDAPTIQAAVDSAAAAGDSVLIGPGMYFQAVVINNKSLVMRSLEGRDQTTIFRNPVALTLSGTGTKKIVDLTFNGTTGVNGLGTFDACAFSFCSTGAVVPSGLGSFTACLFGPNGTGVSGRGTFLNCEFNGNTVGASSQSSQGSTFTSCLFTGNGTGFSGQWSSLVSCEFHGNTGGADVFRCGFTDCDISDNNGHGVSTYGDQIGGGVPTTHLTNCNVERNGGHGIAGDATGPTGTVLRVACMTTKISDNALDALHGSGGTSFNMVDCEISGNGSAGNALGLELTRCVVWGNEAGLTGARYSSNGGGVWLVESTFHANGTGMTAERGQFEGSSGQVTVTRSIVSGTLAGRGVPQCSTPSFLVLSVGCSDIFGNAGGDDVCPEAGDNNFALDPLFCDAAGGDFHLNSNSPCAPGNSPAGCDLIGALTVGCEIVGIDPAASPQLHFGVDQNRPNPFNPSTAIDFTLPVAMPVVLRIYDPAGRVVRTLVEGTRPAGHHSAVWDGREASGREAASGIYYYRIEGEGYGVATRKMLLMK